MSLGVNLLMQLSEIASKSLNDESLSLMLSCGANVDEINIHGLTPLFLTAVYGTLPHGERDIEASKRCLTI